MTSRRGFLKTSASLALGAASAAAAAKKAPSPSYDGPREMPTGVTLLSIRGGDGTDGLGVKLGDADVLNVRRASSCSASRRPRRSMSSSRRAMRAA